MPDCTDFLDSLCVKDSKGNCRACLHDDHCLANPRSDGPTCDTANNICTCVVDADCRNRTTGLRCLDQGKYKVCTCESDVDCPAPYTICEGQVIRRCVKPCTTNSDCKKTNLQGSCDTATGKCSYPEL